MVYSIESLEINLKIRTFLILLSKLILYFKPKHGQIHVAIFQDLRLSPLKWLNRPPNMHVGNQAALVCYSKANSKTMSTS